MITEKRTGGPPRAKLVLISVIGLHLVAETALTPFLPQLFERLYGVEDPGATGLYLWVCRVAGLAALPLWGLAARRWPLHKLVLAGLCGSAVIDLLLGMAPSYAAYTVLSTAVVSTNSALLLAYPAFIAEHRDDPEDGERSRLTGICSIVVVFHLSVVASTLVGAGVLALPEPRIGISAFAVLDILLAVMTYRILGRRRGADAPGASAASSSAASSPAASTSSAAPGPTGTEVTVPDQEAQPPATPPGRPWWRGGRVLVLVQAALIGVAFDFSINVARPFFTEFSDSLGSGSAGSAALFFLPSVAALGVLPAARRCHAALGDRLLPLSLLVAAAGLGWQAFSSSWPELAGGRLLFGLGLGLGQVAVELRMFRATGTAGPAYTAVETARNAGLLAAPLVATAAVSRELMLPLAVAAVVQVLATVLSLRGARRRTAHVPVPAQVPAPAPPSVPAPAPVPVLPAAPGPAPEAVRTPSAPAGADEGGDSGHPRGELPGAQPDATPAQEAPAPAGAALVPARTAAPAAPATPVPAYSEENHR